MNSQTETKELISRREAIRRTALLMGVALSPAWLDGIAAAQASRGPTPAAGQNLDARQMAAVSAIAERLLPRTDTPGARDVGVPAFIDLMVGGYFTDAERGTFFGGLADLEALSQRKQRKSFTELDARAQDELLKEVAAAAQGKEKTFFHVIKDLTVIGYFTAEEVGKKVTHWEPIPGRFEACVPVSEVGNRAWTR